MYTQTPAKLYKVLHVVAREEAASRGVFPASSSYHRNRPFRSSSIDSRSRFFLYHSSQPTHHHPIVQCVEEIIACYVIGIDRLVDPIRQIFLKWDQLPALSRVQPLMIKVGELFLFRRRSRDVGAIKDGNRGWSPTAAISRVLRGRESIGERHDEEESSWCPAPS